MTVGRPVTFALYARDRFGNIAADLWRVTANVHLRSPGRPAVAGTAAHAGSRSVYTLTPLFADIPESEAASSLFVQILQAGGLLATVYTDSSFAAPSAVQVFPTIDFSSSQTAPFGSDPNAPLDFSMRWRGFLRPALNGVHTFSVDLSTTNTADEWFSVYVDSVLLVSRDPSSVSILTSVTATVALQAASFHLMDISYYSFLSGDRSLIYSSLLQGLYANALFSQLRTIANSGCLSSILLRLLCHLYPPRNSTTAPTLQDPPNRLQFCQQKSVQQRA
jgi:hypothetical protein